MNRYHYFLHRAGTTGRSLLMTMVLLLAGAAGATAQTLGVDTTSLDFGTVTQSGDSVTRTFTVSNTDTTLVPLIGVVDQPATTAFSVTQGQVFNLPGRDSQMVTITFRPTMSGTYRDSVRIVTTAGNATVHLRGRAAFASDSNLRIAVAPTVLDFGNIQQGETRQQSFTIRNTSDSSSTEGTDTLRGTIIRPTDPSFTIISGGGTFALRRNDSHVVTVRFNPSTARSYLDSIRINSTAANDSGTIAVTLRGSAFLPPDTSSRITIQPRILDFGTVPPESTSERSFTITNSDTTTGSADTSRRLTGTVAPPANPAFTITSGGGAFSLRRGETRTVTVQFLPPISGQDYADSIRITSNAVNEPAGFSFVYLFGRVEIDSTNADSMFVSRESIDFGTVPNGETRTETFTISNQDTSSISRPIVGNVAAPSNSMFTIVSGGGAFTLARGEQRVVTVQYSPTGSQERTDTGSIRITSNAGDSSTARIIRLQAQSSNPVGSVAGESADAGLVIRRSSPNPFSQKSIVEFTLPRTMHITMALYDSRGVLVASIADGTFPAGENQVTVNAGSLASGIYFLQLRSGSGIHTMQLSVQK